MMRTMSAGTGSGEIHGSILCNNQIGHVAARSIAGVASVHHFIGCGQHGYSLTPNTRPMSHRQPSPVGVEIARPQRIPGDSLDGYLYAAGRFHMKGEGRIGYFGLDVGVTLAEMVRYVLPPVKDMREDYVAALRTAQAYLQTRRITELEVCLFEVCDLRNPACSGLDSGAIYADHFWEDGPFPSQELGRGVRLAGYEGGLVTSVTGIGNNLILFPDNLRAGSLLRIVGWQDPPFLISP